MDKIAELGCIVCRLYYQVYSPAEIHHVKQNLGMGQKRKDKEVIPLCPLHHRLSSTESFHLARKNFIERFGTEWYLFEKTKEFL